MKLYLQMKYSLYFKEIKTRKAVTLSDFTDVILKKRKSRLRYFNETW